MSRLADKQSRSCVSFSSWVHRLGCSISKTFGLPEDVRHAHRLLLAFRGPRSGSWGEMQYHKLPLPPIFLIPGGNRIALPPRAVLPAPAPVPRLVGRASSTLLLAIPKPGVTHPPQLHRNPCQANLPILAPHFGFGQDRRPSSPP